MSGKERYAIVSVRSMNLTPLDKRNTTQRWTTPAHLTGPRTHPNILRPLGKLGKMHERAQDTKTAAALAQDFLARYEHHRDAVPFAGWVPIRQTVAI